MADHDTVGGGIEVVAPDRPPRRGAALAVVGLLVIGALVLSPQLAARRELASSLRAPWWLLLAMFAMVEVFVLHVQVRREAKTIGLSEIPLVLALFYAATPVVLLTRVVGAFLAFVFYRRQRNPVKLAFNVALVVTDLLVALAVFELIAAGASPASTRGWLGAYAAVAAFGLVDAVALSFVIGAYEGQLRVREVWHEAWSATLLSAAVGTLGLVAVASLAGAPQSVWLLGGSVTVLLLAYRQYATLADRHRSLEQLYHFSHVVGSAGEIDDVLRIVLQEARELLKAEDAEVTLVFPGDVGGGVRVALGPSGRLERSELVAPDPEAEMAAGAPVLAQRGTRDRELRGYLRDRASRDRVVVPLRRDGAIVGTVSVANRAGDVRTFDRSDVRLLETVANHAAVAVQNGRLIDQLRYDALHDPLTKLPNRALLMREMRDAIAGVEGGTSPGVAALLMDLDGFKEVNDTLGHHQGDQLLVEVARRLREVCDPDVTVARLGGDEFAVLVPEVADVEVAAHIAQRLVLALRAPFRLSDLQLVVSGSIGVAVAPHHALDASTLLKRADVAMYAAKTSKSGTRIYDGDLDLHTPERLALAGELRQALEREGIHVQVQPKIDLRDGSVTGVEVLARWTHEHHGSIPPSEFVPIAERTGLIRPLTTTVLDAALGACARWRTLGNDLTVAVNLSVQSLLRPDIVDDVSAALARHRVPGERLTLEITEGSAMTDPERTIKVLTRLRNLGIRLSIDDFGTGYSSLAYLKRLPVQELKIDRSFVQHLTTDADDRQIVATTIELAHGLGLEAVAEGVETMEALALLASLGCDGAQGYVISRPIPAIDLTDWATTWEAQRMQPQSIDLAGSVRV